MHSIVNIPHADNKHAVLAATVDHDYAKVSVVDPSIDSPYNSCNVCSLYIGEHMFDADRRNSLRLMVANAIRFAIEAGRGAGYSQAQRDMRKALGIVG